MKRFFKWTGIGLLAIVLVVADGIAGVLWWSFPGGAIDVQIPGLSAPVHIAIDTDGVPRIDAATALDGAAALGFVHARDRFFQMDLMRRVASGRLSELAGPSTLRLDRTMRILGLRRRAEADLPGLDADTRATLEAYARGVNAWIDRRGRFAAPELIPFGTPEHWTPLDSLLWGKTMSLYLSGNWRQELARAALLQTMTGDKIKALWPAQDKTPSPDARLGPAATRLAALVPEFPAPFTQPDTASNEWAVDGAHSLTGKPLLAGDPHLGFSMPGIWYLARIQTPDGAMAGATAPGVPFMVLGHNGKIAWTFTTTGADTQDVFIETPAGDGTYATPTGPQPFTAHDETIHVRGLADEVLHVRETRHGPVLSDLDATSGPLLAVAMANLAPGDFAAAGLLALNRATTVAEAGRAAPMITSPVQNMLVADRDGIGQFTTGRVPVRKAGDGVLPVAGADGLHDWTGFAQGDALPHLVNPASGHIVNANERVAGPDFPVFMGQDWFGDWRAQRIRALLNTRSTHSVNSFALMQGDVTSTFAKAVMPRLLKTKPSDAPSRVVLATFQHWDFAMRIDYTQPLVFNEWMRRFDAALLQRDGIPPGLAGVMPDLVARALGPDGATWCGDGCDEMLSKALAQAAAAFPAGTRWGEQHEAEFAHPLLGRLPVIGWLFTWRIEQPGDDTTLFRGASVGAPGWASVHGPSFRGVYDLADLDRSVFALAPGQSGHPLRTTDDNLLKRWRDGATIPIGPAAKLPKSAKPAETIELRP